jgi:hypothetical protein
VSAVLAAQQQQQQELMWGSINTAQLLADLQVCHITCAAATHNLLVRSCHMLTHRHKQGARPLNTLTSC